MPQSNVVSEEILVDCPESDWKVFRQLRGVALDRFCRLVLGDLEKISHDANRTDHERYLAIWDLLRERDEKMAFAFDDPKRSRMGPQIAAICSLGLPTMEEIDQFSGPTQEKLGSITDMP